MLRLPLPPAGQPRQVKGPAAGASALSLSLVIAMDWSIGQYEHVANGRLPAARAVIDFAAPEPHERVLDIGCGTGNAALLAAERGARVTGVDPAERLLQVARGDAAARGLSVAFLVGEAGALPIADRTVDVVVSAFGVVFAPAAAAAVAETARVTGTRGRVVFSAWLPTGALSELLQIRAQAISAASSVPAGPPPFAWHDASTVLSAFGRHGFSVEFSAHSVAFSAASPQASSTPNFPIIHPGSRLAAC